MMEFKIVSSNLLGLTLQCAQCHSHKFEPISQLDYYRLRAIFAPAFNTQSWVDYAGAQKAPQLQAVATLPRVST